MHQFETFGGHRGLQGGKASDIAARMIEALHEANLDRIGSERKDDRNGLRRRLGGNRRLGRVRYDDDVDVAPHQIGGQSLYIFHVACRETVFNDYVAAFGVAGFSQAAAKVIQIFGGVVGRPAAQITNHRHRGRLCVRRERPTHRTLQISFFMNSRRFMDLILRPRSSPYHTIGRGLCVKAAHIRCGSRVDGALARAGGPLGVFAD